MEKSGVDEDDILEAARLIHGMEKIEDIKYAILERDEAFRHYKFSFKIINFVWKIFYNVPLKFIRKSLSFKTMYNQGS